MKSANGVLILILGILSFVMCGCFTGIPAWVMGRSSMKDIDAGTADPSERTLVQVGMILGIVSTVLWLLGACVYIAAMMGLIGIAALGGAAGPR